MSTFGIEGTGSCGVDVASFLRRSGHRVNCGDRCSRRGNGKTDTLDAEAAARAVLSGEAAAVPKSADGTVEVIRQLKIARDTARKDRMSAIVTLEAGVVHGSGARLISSRTVRPLTGHSSSVVSARVNERPVSQSGVDR